MRSIALLSLLVAGGWILAGCETSGKATGTTAQMYECPGCKDKVTWVYGTGPTKGIPAGQKVVTHTCSVCNQSWVSNVSQSNVCASCMAKEAKCPACAASGG